MAQTSTYLNFTRETGPAFAFYRDVFRTEYVGGITRFGDMPPQPGQPELPEADRDLIVNVGITITGGHVLMGTDAPEGMGFTLRAGNNVHICVQPDDRAEADRLFAALSDGGSVSMPMMEMFWGDYFGSLADRFGIQWMISTSAKA